MDLFHGQQWMRNCHEATWLGDRRYNNGNSKPWNGKPLDFGHDGFFWLTKAPPEYLRHECEERLMKVARRTRRRVSSLQQSSAHPEPTADSPQPTCSYPQPPAPDPQPPATHPQRICGRKRPWAHVRCVSWADGKTNADSKLFGDQWVGEIDSFGPFVDERTWLPFGSEVCDACERGLGCRRVDGQSVTLIDHPGHKHAAIVCNDCARLLFAGEVLEMRGAFETEVQGKCERGANFE